MSSTDTTKPTSANKARPTGTRRAYFIGAATARPTSTTKALPTSTTTARPVRITSSRSTDATANPINPSQTSPTSAGPGTQTNPNNTLRQRMAAELSMAGLAPRSQQTYLNIVDRLAARSWKSVEEISEEEIRAYSAQIGHPIRNKSATHSATNRPPLPGG